MSLLTGIFEFLDGNVSNCCWLMLSGRGGRKKVEHLNNESANEGYGSQQLLQMQRINLCEVYLTNFHCFICVCIHI